MLADQGHGRKAPFIRRLTAICGADVVGRAFGRRKPQNHAQIGSVRRIGLYRGGSRPQTAHVREEKAMRRIILGLLLTLGLLASPAGARDLSDILAGGALRIGICLNFEPMGFRDDENVPAGFEVDVARQMAKTMGLRLEITEITGRTLVPALADGRIDIAACAVTATPERALRTVDFTEPYLFTGIQVLTRRGSGIGSLSELSPANTLLVRRGTTGETLVRELAPAARLAYVETTGDALLMMRQGQADAYVQDALAVAYFARLFPSEFIALPEVYTTDPIAFVVRKQRPDLLRWLDLYARSFRSSRDYSALYAKWWGDSPPAAGANWR
jgi:polar amino acid transport system substrate-binding protein